MTKEHYRRTSWLSEFLSTMRTQHSLTHSSLTFQIDQDNGSKWIQTKDTAPLTGVTAAYRPGIEAEIASRVWPAGEALANYLDFLHAKKHDLVNGRQLKVLELGAGAGIAGIAAHVVLASSAAPSLVVATDLPNAIPLLSSNCDLNRSDNPSAQLIAAPLEWGLPLPDQIKELLPFDIVLMADCIYWPRLHPLLARTCLDLTDVEGGEKTVFMIAYREREPSAEARFFELFGEHFAIDVAESGWTRNATGEKEDDGRLFMLHGRRSAEASADQFEAMKMLSMDL